MPRLTRPILLLGLLMMIPPAHAQWSASGRWDLRASASTEGIDWANGGPVKVRHAGGPDLHLAHGVLALDWRSTERPLDARVILHAADDRPGWLDATEASFRWRPVPQGPWRLSLRAGAFFPEMTIESQGPGWTPGAGLSTSAGNAWIGEELRTLGLEATWTRPGRMVGSAHDWQISAALFGANDTVGALLSWRGWAVGDRLSGLRERIALPSLPAFSSAGSIPDQRLWTEPFRELDGRVGAYVLLGHAEAEGWRSRIWLYDNFADPSVLKNGQYAWHTRFVHASSTRRWSTGWTLALQAMVGRTQMGPRRALVIDNGFSTASVGLIRERDSHRLGLRLEWFDTDDFDTTPDDPNAERGTAVTVFASRALPASDWSLIGEVSVVDSDRAARPLLGLNTQRQDTSLSVGLRRDW